ncbi:MAG: CCDC90 family protein [Deltaproteobacteria bacterium]|nr:CCDC90 family protein [Deltaproteobacteria bacterium]
MSLKANELDATIQKAVTDIKTEFAIHRAVQKEEINGLRTDLKEEINGLRSDLKEEFNGLRADLKEEFNDIKNELNATNTKLEVGLTSLKGELTSLKTEISSLDKRFNLLTKFIGIFSPIFAAIVIALCGWLYLQSGKITQILVSLESLKASVAMAGPALQSQVPPSESLSPSEPSRAPADAASMQSARTTS